MVTKGKRVRSVEGGWVLPQSILRDVGWIELLRISRMLIFPAGRETKDPFGQGP